MNVAALVRSRRTREFTGYFVASSIALAVDMALLLLLSSYMDYRLAATISFIAGSVVHYQLSITFVFRNRKLKSRKWIESVLFVAAGMLGLLVNVGVISFCVEILATNLVIAKLVAAGFSFICGFTVRKLALF